MTTEQKTPLKHVDSERMETMTRLWRDDETTHEQLLRCSPRLQIWDLWNNLSGAQSAKHGQYLCRWKPPCFLGLPRNDPEEFRQNDSSQRGKRSARQCLSHRGCPSFGTFPSDTASWDQITPTSTGKKRGENATSDVAHLRIYAPCQSQNQNRDPSSVMSEG